jgi:hypothetical protein
MLVLVALETAVVVLLSVLVAGLLRSHADILRALHSLGARIGDPGGAEPGPAPLPPPAPARVAGPTGRRAPDLVGVTPSGEAAGISTGGAPMLVAFLSSGCGTCAGFWQALRSGAAAALAPARVVAVTRDPAEESSSALAGLVPAPGAGGADVAVVMASAAWDDYGVPGSPYFVYVDEGGRVAGEGTAARWDQLLSLCSQASADGAGPVVAPGPWATDSEREARADRELLAAGIHPGHPSLYPDRQQ